MSERAPHHNPEHFKPKHHVEHQPHHEKQAKHEREHHKEHKEHAPLPELQKQAKHEARHASEAFPAAQETQRAHTGYVSRELKKEALQRTLTRVRKHLSAPAQTFSKVIHQPVVDAVSQAGAKTIARPSGVLGGSIVAFLGSSIFLWMARHYGFAYNYLLFFLLFLGGFALGMALEFAIYFFRRKHA